MAFHDPADVVAGPPLYGVRLTAASLPSLDRTRRGQFFTRASADQGRNSSGHRGTVRLVYRLCPSTQPSAFHWRWDRRNGSAIPGGGPAAKVAPLGSTSRVARRGFDSGRRG